MEPEKGKYRLLIEKIPESFSYCQIVTDSSGKPIDFIFLDVSNAFTEMTALPRNKIIGKKITELHPLINNSNCDWINTFGKVALTGKEIRFQQYFEMADRWYEIVAYSNEPGYFATVFWDITRSRKNEQTLRKNELRYLELLENLNEVIYTIDDKARISFISPNIERISGFTPSELAGRPFTAFVHPDDFKGREEQFHKILSGVNEASEYRFVTKKGRVIWVRTSARPLIREEHVIGVQGVLMDITERKEAEKEVLRLGFRDSLTGLYNRRFLGEEMKRLDTREQLPISVIMADLNGLKLINDTFGHNKGDEALLSAAHILKKSCRKEDIITRWGGDEFVILLPQTLLREAEVVCKKIMENSRKTLVEGIPISIALGVSLKNIAGKDLSEILNEAEVDMYARKLAEHREARNTILKALLKTLAKKKFETEAHIRHMQNMAMKIGKKIGLPDSELERLASLVSLHDVGKINIPEELITKKEALSAEEKEVIKKHPEIGCRIARATDGFAHVAEDVLTHHEHWDGTGYPLGLKGKKIPLLARITAIVDAYEVMTSGRPYRKAIPPDDTIAELKRCAGSQFDPELVEVFISIYKESDKP